MNSRERFLATMAFEPVDRVPLWEFGYWAQTLERWYGEGLPKRVGLGDGLYQGTVCGEALMWDGPGFGTRDHDVHAQLGLDEGIQRIPLNSYVYPPFEERVLAEDGDIVTVQDPRGHIARYRKDRSSIAVILKTLVETREDWERVKAERFQPTLQGRLPSDWEERREALRRRDFPLCVGGIAGQCGFYHTARYLMGAERLLLAFSDQVDLVKEIMAYLADFWVALFDQVLSQIDVDFAYWTEDIGYDAGPFIGPAMFREFIAPGMSKLTGMLRDHGIRIILVDSDGNNWKLIPEFIAAGVTGMGPMEVAAHMDVWELRQAYPRFQILGGVDKRAVAAGKGAIEVELSKVSQTLRSGGYIPHIDHLTPPDVSWDSFVYYRGRLRKVVCDL
jgi:uroporphyrinogen decarboxylase